MGVYMSSTAIVDTGCMNMLLFLSGFYWFAVYPILLVSTEPWSALPELYTSRNILVVVVVVVVVVVLVAVVVVTVISDCSVFLS